MITRILLPVLAVLGLLLGLGMTRQSARQPPAAQPVAEPARSPYASYVAGAGLIEAATENIAVGASVAGVVSAMHVAVGDALRAGDALFTIDDREAVAERDMRAAELAAAGAQLERLRSLPRAEDVPPIRARVAETEAALADARTRLALAQAVHDARAVSVEELSRRSNAVAEAEALHAASSAELERLLAGAWGPDLAVAQAQADAARSALRAAEVQLERLVVRAPVDGAVLQVKLRVGEYAPSGVSATPLLLMGALVPLHVRVDVDENDAWRVAERADAVGFARGNAALSVPHRFVRIEPYVVPKRSLTGESTERVDPRVLQVVFAFDRGELPLYVGQQLDVFIAAPPLPGAPAAAGGEPPR
jgi:multidrug efflux pump subunit AcrA (membrane-fusion protein)